MARKALGMRSHSVDGFLQHTAANPWRLCRHIARVRTVYRRKRKSRQQELLSVHLFASEGEEVREEPHRNRVDL